MFPNVLLSFVFLFQVLSGLPSLTIIYSMTLAFLPNDFRGALCAHSLLPFPAPPFPPCPPIIEPLTQFKKLDNIKIPVCFSLIQFPSLSSQSNQYPDYGILPMHVFIFLLHICGSKSIYNIELCFKILYKWCHEAQYVSEVYLCW